MSTRPRNLPPHLRLERPLRDGGTSTVWVARDRRSGRWVAVKVVPGPGRGPELVGALRRAERAARSLARLAGHPAVATVRAVGVDDRATVWLVTDLVDGPTLADRVAAGRPLDGVERDRVLRSISGALAAAHQTGVVHGDVSPANVLLGPSGPVLVDFGVGGVDVTPGDGARTALVAPPERLRGARPAPPGDVYSLAATLRWASGPAGDESASVEALLDECTHELPARRPSAAEVRSRAGPSGGGAGG